MFENSTQVIVYFSPYWTFLFLILGTYSAIKMKQYIKMSESNKEKINEYYKASAYSFAFAFFGLLVMFNVVIYC